MRMPGSCAGPVRSRAKSHAMETEIPHQQRGADAKALAKRANASRRHGTLIASIDGGSA